MSATTTAVRRRRAATAGFHLGAGALALLWLLPIALVLVTSLRSFDDIAAAPTVAVFLRFQRHFVAGLNLGAVK